MKKNKIFLKTILPILGTGTLVASTLTATSCSAARAIQFNGVEDFAEYAGTRLDAKQYISSANSTMTNSEFLDQFYNDIKNSGSNRSNVVVDGIFSTYLRQVLENMKSYVAEMNSQITSPDKKIKEIDNISDCIDALWKGFEYLKEDGVFNGTKDLTEIWNFLNSLKIEISPVTIKQESIDIYNMTTKKYLFDQKVDLLSFSILLSSDYSNENININDLRKETCNVLAQLNDYNTYISQLEFNDDNANYMFYSNLFLQFATDMMEFFYDYLYSSTILKFEEFGIDTIDLNFNLQININNLPIFGFIYISEDEAKQEGISRYGTTLAMSNDDIIDAINTDGIDAFATEKENTIVDATGFSINFSNSFLSMFSNYISNYAFMGLMSTVSSAGDSQYLESAFQFDNILHPVIND